MRITDIRVPRVSLPATKGSPDFFLTGGVPVPPSSWLPRSRPQNVVEPGPDAAPPVKRLTFFFAGVFQTIQPLFVGSTNVVFNPSFISTDDMQLFIAGSAVNWLESTMNIDLINGQVGKASFSIFGTTNYRPSVFDDVVFYRKGKRRFGGFVQTVQDNLVGSLNAHILVVSCVDYNGLLDRVIVAKLYTIPIGGLAWIIIFDLIQVYLTQFGVTFAGFSNSGPFVGEVLFHYVTLGQAIAQLVSAAPAIIFWIDAYKLAHYSGAGGTAPAGFGTAPYLLSDTSQNYMAEGSPSGFSVTDDGTLYRNKEWVLPSANLLSLRTETFTGDGSTTGFFTLYVLSNPPVVDVNGTNQIVATLGGPYPTGWTWYFIPQGQGIFQRPGSTPLGITDTLTVSYPNPFSLAISVENDTEIARVGLVEAVLQPQNVFDLTTAEQIATGQLAAYCPNPPQTIVFLTDEIDSRTGQYATGEDGRWLTPGMTITVSKTIPHVPSGSFTVQEIVSQEEKLAHFRHTVTVRTLDGGGLAPVGGMLTLSNQALAASNNNATETAGVQLTQTLVTGDTGVFYIFVYDGILSYWSIAFPNDPPTGADIVIDVLVNGTSILPASSALKVVLPDGQATEEQGYSFVSVNHAVKKGDVVTWNVLQVGSTNPGSGGQCKVVTVR